MTMQRIHSVEPKTAQGRTKELLETVQQAFGVIPNTAKVMANSTAFSPLARQWVEPRSARSCTTK
jgi:hypothetical protein